MVGTEKAESRFRSTNLTTLGRFHEEYRQCRLGELDFAFVESREPAHNGEYDADGHRCGLHFDKRCFEHRNGAGIVRAELN